jgi:hypothetical protein
MILSWSDTTDGERSDDFVNRKHIFAREPLRVATNLLILGSFLWHSHCSKRDS